MRIVHRHERPEPIGTEVAGDDQEITWRDVRQEPMQITECNDSHAVRVSASVASSDTTQQRLAWCAENCRLVQSSLRYPVQELVWATSWEVTFFAFYNIT